uniref:Membrane-associated kinase regulator 6 n=2 Tax=Nelumbo nucifera TaxID=4432 RepID=A0A822XNJ3_NELNU|nr:TPA_asm: hypothetical protein HUJ06_020551 [Nelumbo nucifera]
MEGSQPLSIDSFSYSWLINLKPSYESLGDSFRAYLDASDEASSFIEMDPKLTPSKRFLGDAQDFNFGFPVSQSPHGDLVDADELFSNGLLLPLFRNSFKTEAFAASVDSAPTPLISSSEPSKLLISSNRSRSPLFRRWRRSSRTIFQKYMGFLRPLYKKLRVLRLDARRPETNDARVRPFVRSWDESSQLTTSPRASTAYSTGDWCAIESSIHEAVLHCKKSIEK